MIYFLAGINPEPIYPTAPEATITLNMTGFIICCFLLILFFLIMLISIIALIRENNKLYKQMDKIYQKFNINNNEK